LAKKYYGNGNMYTKIYNANKVLIKNPGLIKPGWKLVIPK
jgi:nucleoid-associated protein YgaU